jgi:hypothetical protein
MLRSKSPFALAVAIIAAAMSAGPATAKEAVKLTKAESALADAGTVNKHTFILFYKTNDAATQRIAKTLADGVAVRADRATVVQVWANDPAEIRLVDKFQVSRTPMPLALCVAPNGAITGVYPQKLEDQQVEDEIVTPRTADCLKHLQDGKVVILCVRTEQSTAMPKAIGEFQADPHFNARLAVVSLPIADKAEAGFLKELEIDAATVKDSLMVFMAPPGVLVGKYTPAAPKSLMAADLHKAGKCCDDPNCKHGKQGK